MHDAAWRDWYRAQHDQACVLKTGTSFEDYVSSVLRFHHEDFINPSPAGSLGDGGSDGMAEAGSIMYACYGSRAKDDSERGLLAKMEGDFSRAHSTWPGFTTWRFVTNAKVGPLCAGYLIQLQLAHEKSQTRPIKPRLWAPDTLWSEAVRELSPRQLDEIFPGVPRAQNLELSDLVPLLDRLNDPGIRPMTDMPIRPVPVGKMEFNALPRTAKIEFTESRLMAPRIDTWFDAQADPDLRDDQGAKFKSIYEAQRRVTDDAGEILERIYTALGGSDFRMDTKRANAVYAVTAYYFDRCHIFEEPPEDYKVEDEHALAY